MSEDDVLKYFLKISEKTCYTVAIESVFLSCVSEMLGNVFLV